MQASTHNVVLVLLDPKYYTSYSLYWLTLSVYNLILAIKPSISISLSATNSSAAYNISYSFNFNVLYRSSKFDVIYIFAYPTKSTKSYFLFKILHYSCNKYSQQLYNETYSWFPFSLIKSKDFEMFRTSWFLCNPYK